MSHERRNVTAPRPRGGCAQAPASSLCARTERFGHAALCLFLSVVLAMGLSPIEPIAQAFADEQGAADQVATAADAAADEILIVYQDEALSLDEEIQVESDGGSTYSSEDEGTTTLSVLGITNQEQLSSPSDEQGAVTLAQLDGETTVDEAIDALEATEGIVSAQPNYTYSLLANTSDTYATDDGNSSFNQYYLYESGTVDAWDSITTEGSVTVATIDTGCNLAHEDLQGTVDAEHAYDATTKTRLADSDVANSGDAIGHGTLVAGVIAAEADNATGIAGASYNANILPVKVFDDDGVCTSADLIAAYGYLDELIDSGEVTDLKVINISLGYYASGNDEADTALESAIDGMRTEHDVLTVCAGGNGNTAGQARADTCYPSDFDSCLSITALDTDGTTASFSDYNAAKDLSAYGVDILSTSADGGYATASGTSMAAPQAAAAAALLWAADKTLDSDEVVSLLTGTASEVADQPQTSGSAGALDVDAAVDEALDEADADETDETDTAEAEDAADAEAAQRAESANEHAVMGSSMREESGANTLQTLATTYTWTKSGSSTWTCSNGTTVTGASAFGVDVSELNGSITWEKAKADGVEYAIIRCGYGNDYTSQDDERFIENVRGCIENDIPFGIYLYSYATNATMAASEAEHVLRVLEEIDDELGVKASDIDYPIYLDLEESSLASTSNRTKLANIASTFCTAIEDADYTAGVYANTNWWTNYLTNSVFDNWTRWVAQYNTTCTYAGTYGMWQRSSSGKVDGISGAVDVDFSYMDSVNRVTGVSTGMGSTTSIKVSWSSLSNADGYQVAYREGTSGSWTIVDVGTAKTTTLSVAKNKAVAIKVRAYYREEDASTGDDSSSTGDDTASAGDSAASETSSETISTGKWSSICRRYTGKASGLSTSVNVAKKKITASWSKFSPSSGSVTYKIQYRTAASSSWTTVSTSSKSKVLSVKKNKAYQIRVYPVVKINGKSYLGAASTTSYRLTSSTTPSISRSGRKSKGKRASVTMSAVSMAGGYQVRYSTKKSFSSYRTKTSTSRKATITGLTRGKTYYVKVRAYKVKNGVTYYGPWSSMRRI